MPVFVIVMEKEVLVFTISFTNQVFNYFNYSKIIKSK